MPRHSTVFRRIHRILPGLVVTLALVFAACDSDDAMPNESQLVGLWVNVDAGEVRAFRFLAEAPDDASAALAAKPFVYELSFYPEGSPPTLVQRGHYSVQFGRLVTEVVEAPLDATQQGGTFGNDIRGFSATRLTLESSSTPSGERVFRRATDLP